MEPSVLFAIVLIGHVVMSAIVAAFTNSRGHRFYPFLFLGLVLSPVVAFVTAVVTEPRAQVPASS